MIADGFFIYGRRCWGQGGEIASGLDASGGHVGETEFSNGETEYHYHIQEEESSFSHGSYYIFPGDYQGTPSNIGA